MKKLLLLAAGAFMSFTALTAQVNNTLVVFSESGERFFLILNGLKQNTEAATNVKSVGLNQSVYKAKVIFERKGLPDCDKTLYMTWEGMDASNTEFVFSVKKDKKGKYKWTVVSAAPISANSPYASLPASNQAISSNTSVTDNTQSTVTTTTSSSVNTNVSGSTTGMNTNVGVTDNTGMNTGVNTNVTTGSNGINTSVGVNDNTGNAGSTTTVTTSTTTTNGNNGMNMGVNMNGMGININMNVNDPVMNGTTTQTSTTTTTTSYTTSSTSVSSPAVTSTTVTSSPAVSTTTTYTNNAATTNTNASMTSGSSSACTYAMGNSDFAAAKKSISSKSFEDSKLTIAKQVMNSNCMNSAQVKEIMSLFSFEETKLDWAKFAYKKTTDKNNYYTINDGFTFESSIDELNDYISKNK